jgi:hypothetical protein
VGVALITGVALGAVVGVLLAAGVVVAVLAGVLVVVPVGTPGVLVGVLVAVLAGVLVGVVVPLIASGLMAWKEVMLATAVPVTWMRSPACPLANDASVVVMVHVLGSGLAAAHTLAYRVVPTTRKRRE